VKSRQTQRASEFNVRSPSSFLVAEALGVDLQVLDEAIDTTTPSDRLLFHVLGAGPPESRGERRESRQGLRPHVTAPHATRGATIDWGN
jgi:hypothetical protein